MSVLLDRLCKEAPPLFDTIYRPDRCIVATRTAIAVLDYFGIQATAVKTQAIAGNKAWKDWMDEDGPTDGPMPEQAWAVGIDLRRERDGRYPGHLVARADLPDGPVLLDLSLGQLSRPQKGMELPEAAWFRLGERWDEYGGEVYAIRNETDEPTYLLYRRQPEKDWTRTKDWTRKPALAGALIRALR